MGLCYHTAHAFRTATLARRPTSACIGTRQIARQQPDGRAVDRPSVSLAKLSYERLPKKQPNTLGYGRGDGAVECRP